MVRAKSCCQIVPASCCHPKQSISSRRHSCDSRRIPVCVRVMVVRVEDYSPTGAGTIVWFKRFGGCTRRHCGGHLLVLILPTRVGSGSLPKPNLTRAPNLI